MDFLILYCPLHPLSLIPLTGYAQQFLLFSLPRGEGGKKCRGIAKHPLSNEVTPHPPNWLRPAVSSFFAPFRPPSYYYSNNKNYTFS